MENHHKLVLMLTGVVYLVYLFVCYYDLSYVSDVFPKKSLDGVVGGVSFIQYFLGIFELCKAP